MHTYREILTQKCGTLFPIILAFVEVLTDSIVSNKLQGGSQLGLFRQLWRLRQQWACGVVVV